MAFVGSLSGSGGASNTINVTGSMIIANPGTGGTFPSFPGTDTVFFVSGAIDGKAAGSRTVSVFGGDVVASGSITIGTGSITIDSNEIRFLGGAAKITSSSAGLTFFDSNNTGGKSLTELAAAGGGGGGAGVFTEASATAAFTTSSIAIGFGAAASSLASDLFFYVSGSTDGTKNALFGGDVVTSGSLTVNDGAASLSIFDNTFGTPVVRANAGNLVLDATGINRIVADKDFELSSDNLYAGGGGGLRNVFPDNVSPSHPIVIGGAASRTVTSGTLQVIGNDISGSAGRNLTLGSGGDVTVAGDLTVTGNDIKSSTGATAITLSGGNVIIPGDLTVQGTTVTVDATTLTIEDPVIGLGFTSGSTATTAGDRGFIGGISGGDNVALIWDNTDSTFTSARTSTGAGNDPVAITSYTPFRASSFEVGGTPGSAVAAGSAYLSSSDALNVLVNHTATTTFTKSGTAIVQITDNGGQGMITGNSAIDTIDSLWASGSTVNMAHTLAPAVGPVPHGIKIVGGGVEGGSLRITTSGATPTLNINSHDGGNTPKALIVSGSAVAINAATSNSTNGVTMQGAGTSLARFWGSATNTEIDLLGTTNNVIDGTANAAAELSLSGSNVNLRHGAAGGQAISLQRVTTEYGELQFVADGPRNYAVFNSTAGNVRIGSAVSGANTGNINLSGSNVEILATNGMQFQTAGSATTYLTVASGSYSTPVSTLGNAARIESSVANSILLGSQASTILSGTNIRANVGGTNTFAIQRDGATFLTFASGSGAGNDITIAPVNATTANLLNTVATTVNFAGAATTLEIGSSTGTTSINNSLTVDGTTTLGNATGDDITFNGYAASSLIPKTTNSFDLGTPDLRWRNMYTGDLHLKNERGDWTVIEEEDFLTLTNNKSGKRYKFVLEEI